MTTKRPLLNLVLLAGSCWLAACTPREPAPRAAVADAAPSAAPSVAPSAAPEPVAKPVQPDRPQSAEQCRQTCNGEWSAHGLAAVVSCLCRTRDFGKDCRDRADCQGECLLESVRTEVRNPGPPALGHFIGKCSEFVTTFGCVRRIPLGARERGPVDLSELPPAICMD